MATQVMGVEKAGKKQPASKAQGELRANGEEPAVLGTNGKRDTLPNGVPHQNIERKEAMLRKLRGEPPLEEKLKELYGLIDTLPDLSFMMQN